MGSVHQGAIQNNTYQGAIQVQAIAGSDNLADGISLLDTLVSGAEVPLSDEVVVTDKGFPVFANLNGSSQYFYRNDVDFPEARITSNMSAQAWINPSLLSLTNQVIISKYTTAGNKRMYYIGLTDVEAVVILSSDGSAKVAKNTSGLALTINEWTHIAWVYNATAGTVAVYKNGYLHETLTGFLNFMTGKDSPFIIGAYNSGQLPMHGGISNVALFDDIRTPAEILASYQNKWIDLSGEGNIIGQWMFNEAAGASFIDNTQGDAGRDLVPYNGGDTTFGNCGRETGHASDITLGAGVAPADVTTLSDNIVITTSTILDDAISLTDSFKADALDTLSDTIALSENLATAVSILFEDVISLGICSPPYTHLVMETMTHTALELLTHADLESQLCVDELKVDAGIGLSETIATSDMLSILASAILDDTVTLADVIKIIQDSTLDLSDALAIIDLLVGVLAEGYITPGTAGYAYETVGPSPTQPKTWRKTVTNEPSPISALTQSSAGTTFTITSVADSAAWDLTQVAIGDVAITGDKYLAMVRGTGADSITVDAWTKAGHGRRRGATDKPTDGETVTIHRLVRARQVLLRAGTGNTNVVYQGFSEWVNMNTGHPIPPESGQVNSALPITAPRDRWLNTSRVWLISGTTQEVIVTIDAMVVGQYSSSQNVSSSSPSDSMSMDDNLGIKAGVGLGDDLNLSDNLTGVLGNGGLE